MIEPDLLRQLERRAAEEGRALQAVTNDLPRRALTTPAPRRFVLELQGWQASEQPGVDILDRDELFDLMNGR